MSILLLCQQVCFFAASTSVASSKRFFSFAAVLFIARVRIRAGVEPFTENVCYATAGRIRYHTKTGLYLPTYLNSRRKKTPGIPFGPIGHYVTSGFVIWRAEERADGASEQRDREK